MIQLTKEEIRFVDAYLKQSDVIFVDIRAEMTDHIATAVERKMEAEGIDFYNAFKIYMAANKKGILASNNKMYRDFPQVLGSFLRTLYRPYNLVSAVLLLLLFHYISGFNEAVLLKSIHKILFASIFGFAVLQLLYSWGIMKARYMCLEKTVSVLLLIYYTDLFVNGFSGDFYGNRWSLGIAIFLFVAFVAYYIETLRKFKLHYR